MKRFHVHVGVEDLEQSIRFYSTLFAAAPSVRQPDYAKWMLEDPRVNFAISLHPAKPGIEHLGIEVESAGELTEVHDRLSRAEGPVLEEKATTCCYAQSDKQWIADPQGVAWETFFTHGASTTYGQSGAVEQLAGLAEASADAPCCAPAAVAPSDATAQACGAKACSAT